MSHRIILLMPLFNRRGDLFILLRLFAFEIVGSSCDLQCSGHLAFGVGAVRPTQLMRQFHLLCRLYLLSSPEAFFSISFCTVNSPMIFFKSSGDSPGSYPWNWAFCLGSRYHRRRWLHWPEILFSSGGASSWRPQISCTLLLAWYPAAYFPAP